MLTDNKNGKCGAQADVGTVRVATQSTPKLLTEEQKCQLQSRPREKLLDSTVSNNGNINGVGFSSQKKNTLKETTHSNLQHSLVLAC